MRWIIQLKGCHADRGLSWSRRFLDTYDTSRIEWVRIDQGRGNYQGVYGRCWYPTDDRPTFRISCQVPGPFPCDILTRKPPLYPREDGTFPRAGRGTRRGQYVHDPRTGREWYRVLGCTRVETIDEGIVWILAHEAFHFLRQTRQIPGRNNEIEADHFADQQVEDYRCQPVERDGVAEPDQFFLPFGV